MANCLEDKSWESKVPKDASKEKGEFEITRELGNGDFEGVFQDSAGVRDNIKGNCSAAKIWFHRPATNPTYLYSGNFIYEGSEKKFVRNGTRNRVGFDALDATFDDAMLVADDWEADKIT